MIYASAGTLMVVFVFGQKLMGLNFNQLRREADFRFSLVRVRENAESIAFYRGEAQELKQVQRRFGKAFDNFNRSSAISLRSISSSTPSLLTLVIPSAMSPRAYCRENWKWAAPSRRRAPLRRCSAPSR